MVAWGLVDGGFVMVGVGLLFVGTAVSGDSGWLVVWGVLSWI
jgi:hypothetical protein